MKNLSVSSIVISFFATFLVVGLAWAVFTPPTVAPPGGNVDPPLNVGPDSQEKIGGLILNTGGAPTGLIVENGSVGIGTTSPTGALTISGANRDVRHYSYHNCELCGADYEFYRARGTEAAPLPVVGFGGDNDKLGSIRFYGYDGTGFAVGAQIRSIVEGSVGSVPGDMPAGLEFRTKPNVSGGSPGVLTTRMVIHDDGQIGFGTENPKAELHIYATDGITAIRLEEESPGNSPAGWEIRVTQSPDDALSFYNLVKSAYRVVFGENGNVGIGTTSPNYKLELAGCSGGNCAGKPDGTSWTNTSDARLKNVSGNYEYGLEEILSINPVRFRYKENNPLLLPSGGELIGLLAQEVQESIPDAVFEGEDGYLRLNADPVFWAMLNAIKELKAENDDLRARVDLLETQ